MNIPENVKRVKLTDLTEANIDRYRPYMSAEEIAWWEDWYPRYLVYKRIIVYPNFKGEYIRAKLREIMGIHRFQSRFVDRLPDNLPKKSVTYIAAHEYKLYEPYMNEQEKELWARHMERRRAEKRVTRQMQRIKRKKANAATGLSKAVELAERIRLIRESKAQKEVV